MGRTVEAVQCLRRSLDLDPSWESVHELLGDALMKSDDLGGAEVEYRAALSVYDAKYKKGESTSSFDSLVKSLVKIEAADHAEHSLAETHLKLARLLMLEKKWEPAVQETKVALDADETAFRAYYLRAQIYDAAGDHGRAEEARRTAAAAIQKLIQKESAHSSAQIEVDPRLLFLSEGLDSESGALALAPEVVSIAEPKIASLSPLDRLILAGAYFELGRVQDGEEQCEKGISGDPKLDNPAAHANLGQRLLKAGALAEALAHLRKAYKLDPQNTTYRMDYEATKQALVRKCSAP